MKIDNTGFYEENKEKLKDGGFTECEKCEEDFEHGDKIYVLTHSDIKIDLEFVCKTCKQKQQTAEAL